MLLKNWQVILLLIASCIGILAALKFERHGHVRKVIFYLVVRAEQMFGSKTGPIKLDAVWSWILRKYPWVRWFLTEEEVNNLIKEALDRLEEILAKGDVNLLSYAEEREAAIKQ